MASFIANSFVRDVLVGNIDLDTDTFYAMLCTSSYTPNKDTHTKRSDVTNEVSASGTGYTTGGLEVEVTVAAVDTDNDRVVVTIDGYAIPASTITARYAVIYKHRGGLASADELVAVIDFGGNVSTSGSTFTLSASTLTAQN